eukprot:4457628-Alexandrium_andersonii.AAC.1
MTHDPDTNERYFGSNVVVIIDDATNAFLNTSWTTTDSNGNSVVVTRDMVIAGAPTHVGGAPLPKNQDAV